MAGKSGRSINNVPESPIKKLLFGWEGILILVFIGVNIFCKWFSEYYNMFNLLRQMPVYLAEVFLMLMMAFMNVPSAHILITVAYVWSVFAVFYRVGKKVAAEEAAECAS